MKFKLKDINMPKYIVTNNKTKESFYECVSDIARRIGIFQRDTIADWAKRAESSGVHEKTFDNFTILFTTFKETKVNTGFRLKIKN